MMIPDLITPITQMLLWALFGYALGTVPFGIVISRLMGLGDLRQIGSGNIGATNVLRTGSKLGAFLTLVLDAGKAGFAVLIIRAFGAEDAAQLAGFAAFVGHCYPIWLGFRGGKGVATFFGLVFALSWPWGFVAGAVWLAVAGITRYSSLAALISVIVTAFGTFFIGPAVLSLLLFALAVLIFWRHRENIARLIKGQESKIGTP